MLAPGKIRTPVVKTRVHLLTHYTTLLVERTVVLILSILQPIFRCANGLICIDFSIVDYDSGNAI